MAYIWIKYSPLSVWYDLGKNQSIKVYFLNMWWGNTHNNLMFQGNVETKQKTGHGPYSPQVTKECVTAEIVYLLFCHFLFLFSIFALFRLTNRARKLWGALKHLLVLHFFSSTRNLFLFQEISLCDNQLLPVKCDQIPSNWNVRCPPCLLSHLDNAVFWNRDTTV